MDDPGSYFYSDVADVLILEMPNIACISPFLFPVVKWTLLTLRGRGP
jgi:hypothetical protein